MRTYANIIAGLDNPNYRGKNTPVKRANIVSEVTIETLGGRTYNKTFYDPHKRWAIRSVYNYVNFIQKHKIDDTEIYDFDLDEYYPDEIKSVTIRETDKDGNVTIINQ